ncbi:exopolyphosphatase [Peptoniphilus sp. KCTC 25270]|uniref:Ppx/GppA phosphatase family protein n=1 Tax=Peptoniphilus sp. KCTC 25270 TaxID=2897414 RepID=UPI001E2B1DBA|nr:exopolyphosphatase [Peptoniphilus sp. KCTC 25270]MCD1147430.1 exopolyphosphatase [Peptoniphilus sp. KCTC 25270]
MIHGVIDIGSNTIRLSVFKIEGEKVMNLFNEKATAGLAGYREEGRLSEEGIEVLLDTLEDFSSLMGNFDEIKEIHAIATASIRNVSNSQEIIDRVKKKLGLKISLLSGEEEAYLAYLGARESIEEDGPGVLADIGGGSTEVVLFHKGKVFDSASLDMGSLSVYKEFVEDLFITTEERKAMDAKLKESLSRQDFVREGFTHLCAVGGSARATLKLYNAFYKEDRKNQIMDVDDLKQLMQSVLELEDKEKMNQILKIKADRIHTLLPGLCILYRVAKFFHVDQVSVSQTGIREGYIYKNILRRG